MSSDSQYQKEINRNIANVTMNDNAMRMRKERQNRIKLLVYEKKMRMKGCVRKINKKSKASTEITQYYYLTMATEILLDR